MKIAFAAVPWIVASASLVAGQNSDPTVARNQARLVASPQLGSLSAAATATVEVTIQWETPGATVAARPGSATAVSSDQFQAVASRIVASQLPRERDPQLSEDQLVVMAVDEMGEDVGWQLVKDPSIVRSEQPGTSGQLSGTVLRQSGATFVVTLPRVSPTIGKLHVYKPRWTGAGFTLTLLGDVSIPETMR